MKSVEYIVRATMVIYVSANTLNNTETLVNDLLNDYKKIHRPLYEQTDTLQINITYDISSIQGFNEVEGALSVSPSFIFSWIDERMKWDPVLYNYTYTIVLPLQWVWFPQLLLLNPADSVKPLTNDWDSVRIIFNGIAFWYPTDILRVSCTVNIKYYPFDVQTCLIMLMAPTYASTELLLYAVNKEASRTYFLENGEWELIKTESSVAEFGASLYIIKLVLARRPLFIVIIVIIPIFLLSLLNILVFVLPADSGERVSYTITLLLALAVFLTIISDNIPKTSSPLSILCYFIGAQLLLSTIICCVTICNLRLFFKDDSIPVPAWLCLCIRRNTDELETPTDSVGVSSSSAFRRSEEHVQITSISNGDNMSVPSWKRQNTHQNNSGIRQNQTTKSKSRTTWKEISIWVDKVMFGISLTYLLISCAIYTFVIIFKDDSENVEFTF